MQQRTKQSLYFDSLGDKHKKFEGIYAGQILIPGVPVIARLDGRAFHTFTKNAIKPFDIDINIGMTSTAKHLLGSFHPDLVYTQSDEISLVWGKGTDMFDGNVLKLTSTLSSMASVVFYDWIQQFRDRFGKVMPTFDCRIWQVPDEETAAENLMWREMDATKNSISMLASCHFSVAELHGKSTKDRLAMLESKGIHWENLDHWLKKGAYFRKEEQLRNLTKEELSKIPEKYHPEGPILRSEVKMLSIPKATSIMNLAGVLFHGEDPTVFPTTVPPIWK
ncbi:MAG: hypothetical protein COZ77_05285 [Gallionellales bacterium CG_4_8_14_3_um_filter_54_18]|nr:MAG: hypothetical protein COZ77_05285 [Gallionellales bacterium CG_4_8_14_3_um_filter_54_18]